MGGFWLVPGCSWLLHHWLSLDGPQGMIKGVVILLKLFAFALYYLYRYVFSNLSVIKVKYHYSFFKHLSYRLFGYVFRCVFVCLKSMLEKLAFLFEQLWIFFALHANYSFIEVVAFVHHREIMKWTLFASIFLMEQPGTCCGGFERLGFSIFTGRKK